MASGWSPVAVASVSQNPTETLYTATGVLGFFYRRISAVKHCRGVMGQPIKKCIFFYFLRVSSGDQPLAKVPEDSGCNISNTRRCVSSDIQTLRSRLKKRGAAEFFLNDFEVFGCLMKHTFECSDMASQMINNSWRNSRLKLAKFYGHQDHISKPRSQ